MGAAAFAVGVVAMLLFMSCQSHLLTYQEDAVAEFNRLDLSEGGPHTGEWQSSDLSIHYRYWRNQQDLKMSGKIELAQKLTHFRNLDHLRIEIHFLNQAGTILGSRQLYHAPFRQWLPLVDLSFAQDLKIPADTTQIVYSYDGRVDEGGSHGNADNGEGVSWDFWKTP